MTKARLPLMSSADGSGNRWSFEPSSDVVQQLSWVSRSVYTAVPKGEIDMMGYPQSFQKSSVEQYTLKHNLNPYMIIGVFLHKAFLKALGPQVHRLLAEQWAS